MAYEPTISIVIPCFNQGEYLLEALCSAFAQTTQSIEVIIVNDGSSDVITLKILEQLMQGKMNSLPAYVAGIDLSKLTIIHTENKGPAQARNKGISISRGKYILPLDADDKIAPTYCEKAAAILDTQPDAGIVYCQANFFGFRQGPWNLSPYRFPEILLDNCIFCTALFRRDDWSVTKGYNANMKHGWEDYDFWLSLIELGRKVVQIKEVLFFYRQTEESRTTRISPGDYLQLYLQLINNHQSIYKSNLPYLMEQCITTRERINTLQQEHSQLIERFNTVLQHIDQIEDSKTWKMRKTLLRLKTKLGF